MRSIIVCPSNAYNRKYIQQVSQYAPNINNIVAAVATG